MEKLKLDVPEDERPVKLSVTLPAPLMADLAAYALCLAKSSGAVQSIDPARLIAPMLARFLATDRAFSKLRRTIAKPTKHGSPQP